MITRKYVVVSEPAADHGRSAHGPLLDIIIEGETLEAVREIAPSAIDNALACLKQLNRGARYLGKFSRCASVA